MPRAEPSSERRALDAASLVVHASARLHAGDGVLRAHRGHGPPACFQTHAVYSCGQPDCPWREACGEAVSPWLFYP